MRILCGNCESAAAVVFCAADEAALCRACDDKVHLCNKLASRHVRVGLANPVDVPCCDICENETAFFYCEVDGSSLCLQCDTYVHVGGKRTHERYLLLRQRVEFPGDRQAPNNDTASKPNDQSVNKKGTSQHPVLTQVDCRQNHVTSPIDVDSDGTANRNGELIDLNTKPCRTHEHSNN